MTKKLDPAPVEDIPDFNPLNLPYGRFDEKEIAEYDVRDPVNTLINKFSAMRAISAVLYASEIEKQAQGKELALTDCLTEGLFLALKELAADGTQQAELFGNYFRDLERKGGTQ